jgi:hypothetical protein
LSSSISTANKENRRKTLIVYSVFGLLMIVFVIYAYESFFATSGPAPNAQQAPVITTKPTAGTPANGARSQTTSSANQPGGAPVAPGVDAAKLASTSSSLDPTLDQNAMLRTESLVYSGSGRNIFSMTYVAPVAVVKNLPPARPVATAPVAPTAPAGPPPLPPINLKFFGTMVGAGGKKQAFLLQGEDVYLASQGDIVARKYKIMSITERNIQVQDLTNANTQTLPLQAN